MIFNWLAGGKPPAGILHGKFMENSCGQKKGKGSLYM